MDNLEKWKAEVRKFRSQSKEEQAKWCSWCGCEGGCNLCVSDAVLKEYNIKL